MVTRDHLAGALVAGQYRVLRELGRGACATTYVCRRMPDQRLVVLKLLHPQLTAAEDFRTQFLDAIGAAAQLHSPNIIPILEFGEDLALGSFYIVVPYVDHRDLGRVIREDRPLTDERIVGIVAQVLNALAGARAFDVIHLGLKPTNIFAHVGSDGRDRVLVGDFGCARLSLQPWAADSSQRARSPSSMPVADALAYASPEQFRGGTLDARSDLYALGVILYQLLTGRLPFETESAVELAQMHCGQTPPPPSGFGPVNRVLESVCLKALSKTREARFQTAQEMLAALGAVRTETAPTMRERGDDPALPSKRTKHGSLAPSERTLPAKSVPKRRAGLAWISATGLACAAWVSYSVLVAPQPMAETDVKGALAAESGAASSAKSQLDLLTFDGELPAAEAIDASAPEAHADSVVSPPPSAAGEQAVDAHMERATLALGATLLHATASESMLRSLDQAAMTDCYRASLRERDTPKLRIEGRLDLESALDGRIRWAKLHGMGLSREVRRCIENVAMAARLPEAPRVHLEASVNVEFDPH